MTSETRFESITVNQTASPQAIRRISAPPAYSLAEEISHSITHGVGIVLAIAGLCILVAQAALHGDVWHVVSCAIFGSAMVLMYMGSTVYHAVQNPRAKAELRKVDQSMVYLLIAGTYTPFNLVTLHGPVGWWLFGITWGVGLFGMLFCIFDHERHERFALTFYLGLGWCVVFAVPSLLEHMQPGGLVLIFGGGLCYTIGVAFYLREKIRYFHAIWHLFVLAGSTLHFFCVLLYVIPGTTAPSLTPA